MKKVEIKILSEAIPYLVKGMSLNTNEEVIGFPYVHMVENGDEVKYLNVILVPDDNGEQGFVQHPILGNMYRYSHKNSDGESIFEDVSMEDEIIKASLELAKDFVNAPEDVQKLLLATFMYGITWAAQNGVTTNNLKKNDTEQGV